MGGGKYELKQILIWFGQNSLCLMLVHQLIKVVLDECVLSFIDNHFIVMGSSQILVHLCI